MNAMFKQFADSRLTREQMKEVKGGKVSCEATFTTPGGEQVTYSNNCGYSSVSYCMSSVTSGVPSSYTQVGGTHCDLV